MAIGFTSLIRRAIYNASATQALSTSGAISLTTRWHTAAVSGTVAYTLANGLWVGQQIHIECISAASTPHGVVTPASAGGFTSFDLILAGQIVCLVWKGTAWRMEFVSTKNGVALPIFT